jgi:hypothetical protein
MKKSYVNYLIIAVCFSIFSTAWGQEPTPRLRFRTNLTGAQEVTDPPGGVTTDTRGRAEVNFNRGLSRATVEVIVNGGAGIILAHLHCASAGVNGPIAVTLFDIPPPGQDINGELVQLTVENDDITDVSEDPACGVPLNNIAALAFAMSDGKIYVNVHSTAFPDGVVRGQLLELD